MNYSIKLSHPNTTLGNGSKVTFQEVGRICLSLSLNLKHAFFVPN